MAKKQMPKALAPTVQAWDKLLNSLQEETHQPEEAHPDNWMREEISRVGKQKGQGDKKDVAPIALAIVAPVLGGGSGKKSGLPTLDAASLPDRLKPAEENEMHVRRTLNIAAFEGRTDTTAPTITSFSPADGATGVPLGSNIVLKFNEAIARGSGTITLRTGSATGTIIESFNAASSNRLTIADDTLIIDPKQTLRANKRYFLVLPSGSVKDLAGNNYAGTNIYDFRTLTPDTTAPSVSSFSPTDGATGVPVGSDVVVTFNEAITRGSGTITLRTGSATGAIIESFDAATSNRLLFNGNTLSVDPSADLNSNTRYFLVMPSGSVKDLAGNNYAGTSSYDFTTKASGDASFNPGNNPLYVQQWHLQNSGQGGGTAGIDANVQGAWSQAAESGGILGRNVVIAIVDDGLQYLHPDLQANYLAAASYDYNFNDSDPSPGSSDSHGTAVAGVAAAVGNNTIGVTGAAPLAKLAGIRLIAAASTDEEEAQALNHALQINSIYSNSWGPADSGTQLAAIGPQAKNALYRGVTTGRDGKGSIYTWAGGNGKGSGDNSNYDGYANSPYVIAVGAVNNYGKSSGYSEPGANLLVSAPSSGGSLGIVTTDLMGSSGYNGISNNNYYTNQFGGTSSATPLVSGVIALMLEANPNLSWRDVMHILVRSSRDLDLASKGWQTNGAGHTFHHDYGHGMVDADAAVNLSRNWTLVDPLTAPINASKTVNKSIPDSGGGSLKSVISISDNIKIESVEILFNATHTYRGDLEILLTSPSGSTSILATVRNDSNNNYSNWTFSSRVHWDELSQGDWTLTVTDRYSGDTGTLLNWGLTINGTEPGGSAAMPASETKVVSNIDAEAIASAMISGPGMSEGQNWKSASSSLTSRLDSDPLVEQWGGVDKSLAERLPHLDAYIAWVNERLSAEEINSKDVEWTVATYGHTTSVLDRITGVQSRISMRSTMDLLSTPLDYSRSTIPGAPKDWDQVIEGLEVSTVKFQPDFAPAQIATDLESSLGSDVAFFYPHIAYQQTLRSELPWVTSNSILG